MSIEIVWEKIRCHEGEIFKTIRGKEYNYAVYNDYILINDDKKRRINKLSFELAITIVNPTPSKIKDKGIWGPSYVYGIITDRRIN